MIEPTLSRLRNSTLKLNFKRHVPMPYMFYCFLVQFDHGVHVLKKKNRSFRGPSWGGYLCPYVAMTQYFAIYLCPYVLMSPVWISKPVVFGIIDDEETMLLLVFYYCIWDCPHRCRNFNIIFMSFVANLPILSG